MLLGARQFFAARKAAPISVLRFRSGIDARSNATIPNGDFTICFWMKCYRLDGASDLYAFGWEDGGWGGTRLMINSSRLYFRYATGTSASQYNVYDMGNLVSDEQWHFYAIRLNGTSLTITLDDTVILSTTISGTHQGDLLPLSIGSIGNDSNSNAQRGDKSIGFFCLFNRALSDAEIASAKASRHIYTSLPLYNGLVCGYELSESTKMTDATWNYNLTLHNAYGAVVEYNDELPA